MSYVGNGFGAYVQEVTYRYVGAGGTFDVVQTRRTNFCCIGSIGVIAIVALVLLVLSLLPKSGCDNPDSLSEIELKKCCNDGSISQDSPIWSEKCVGKSNPCDKTQEEDLDLEFCCQEGYLTVEDGCPVLETFTSECILWGDPHVQTFDSGHADFYSEGEVWLVKSQSILMQARYAATPFTDGKASTETLAIGGSFLGMNTLKVGPMNSQITWNDRPILTTKPSSFELEGFGIAYYNDEGDLVDNGMAQEMAKYKDMQKNAVHIDLPNKVHVQVMRWSHHINVKIVMHQAAGGQDGHCGNFNRDAADDTTAAILLRMGRGVSSDESLFNNYVPYHETKPVSVNDCAPDKRAKGEEECKKAGMHGPGLADCVIDYCIAGPRYVLQDMA